LKKKTLQICLAPNNLPLTGSNSWRPHSPLFYSAHMSNFYSRENSTD